MVTTSTSGRQATTSADIAALGESFGRHLRAANRSPMTLRSYLEAIRQLDAFLADRGMPRSVANITREHVESFIGDQLERLKPASAANRFRSLQQYFRWVLEEGEIKVNPMARMKAPHVPETPPPVIREDDLRKLLAACAGADFDARRDKAIITLLIDTGVRRAELAGLTVEDVDFGAEVFRVVGKGSRPRVVPMGAKATQALDRYLRVRSKHSEARSPWLWLGRRGHLNDSGVSQMLRRRAHDAGIGEIHAHLFRHTAAHELAKAGMGDSDLMRLMGWRSRTMLTRYGASAASDRAILAHRKLSPADKL